jgi:hypothetical protein
MRGERRSIRVLTEACAADHIGRSVSCHLLRPKNMILRLGMQVCIWTVCLGSTGSYDPSNASIILH